MLREKDEWKIVGRCPKCGHFLSRGDLWVVTEREEQKPKRERMGWREQMNDAALAVGWVTVVPLLFALGLGIVFVLVGLLGGLRGAVRGKRPESAAPRITRIVSPHPWPLSHAVGEGNL